MSDEKSTETISRLKAALANKSVGVTANSSILESNRGKKLLDHQDDDNLRSKIVQFNGVSYWVTSNNRIDQTTQKNKRKWNDYYHNTQEYKRARHQESDEEEPEHEHGGPGQEDDSDSEEEYSYDTNPLEDFDVTEILSSISHPSELVSHPAISRTYKSEILAKLSSELIDLIEIEQNTLNSFNKLLQVLNGEDWHYFLEENLGLAKYDHGLVVDNQEKADEKEIVADTSTVPPTNATESEVSDEIPKRITRTSHTENDEVADPFFKVPKALEKYEELQSSINGQDTEEGSFNAAREDLINHLQVSIQRQQEYIKNLSDIRNHLVRADRLKSNLLKWGKEMFDKKSN